MKVNILLFVIPIFIFVASCSSTPQTASVPLSTDTVEATSTPSGIFQAASRTPTSFSTGTARPVLTSTTFPTRTPLPTLEKEEAQAILQELFTHNAGCQLPCWWGFTLGKTEWSDALIRLEPLAVKITSTAPRANPTSYEVWLQSESDEWHPDPRKQVFTISDGILQKIKVNSVNLWPYGDLVTMLRLNGSPEEIWISTGALDTPPVQVTTIFQLFLYYQKQGVMVWYEDVSASVTDQEIIGCPHLPAHGLYLYLWNPEAHLPFLERLEQMAQLYDEEKHQPLTDATGITIDEYYNQLMDEEWDTPCLRTPLQIW